MAIVGLLTDFGWGIYDGVLRALARCLGVDPIDLTHSVPSFSTIAGAYALYNTMFWLPHGSGVAVVVDPGVGSSRRALLFMTKNYYITAPDNGVAYPAATEDGVVRVYALREAEVLAQARERCSGPPWGWSLSRTFHGRDIFLPAVALAVLGEDPEKLGEEVSLKEVRSLRLHWSREIGESIEYKVVYVDKFGNVALSTQKRPPYDEAIIEAPGGSLTVKAASTFSEVPMGSGLMYINSFGFLEIAVNRGNAAELLGVKPGDRIVVRRKERGK